MERRATPALILVLLGVWAGGIATATACGALLDALHDWSVLVRRSAGAALEQITVRTLRVDGVAGDAGGARAATISWRPPTSRRARAAVRDA